MRRFRSSQRHDRHSAPGLVAGPDAPLRDDTLAPVIGALQAVEQALRQERFDRAWIDLDIASTRLARESSVRFAVSPALDRAMAAVERARDLLGRAQVTQATATITSAVMALLG